jgi:hypothetical protein
MHERADQEKHLHDDVSSTCVERIWNACFKIAWRGIAFKVLIGIAG